MPTTMQRKGAVLAALLLLAGCGLDSEPIGFLSSDALKAALDLRQKMVAGDKDGVRAMLKAPFRFKTRTWVDPKDLDQNFPALFAAFAPDLSESEDAEAYSFVDLIEGRWPRGRQVATKDRGKEARALGVGPGGFLVRLGHSRQFGIHVVLEPEGERRLVVVGMY